MQKKLLKIFVFIDKPNFSKLSKLKKNTNIIYRNYKKNIDESEIILLKKFCKNKNFKFYLANNIKLALKLNLDGLYIPAFNTSVGFKNTNKPKKFEIIGSAHNTKEIKIKENQGCKFIFLSPIFKVAKKTHYLGTVKFNLLTRNTKKKVIALGGISRLNFKKLNLLNIKGFAGISFFQIN